MKKLTYFAAANLWGLVAFTLAVGHKVERTNPVSFSFAGYGWLDATAYALITMFCVVAAGIFAWLSFRKEPAGAPALKSEPKP